MSGLESEFPAQVTARNIDAFTEEGKDAVKTLGFKNHGLVIRDAAGKALWKQADHGVNIEDVRKALKELTGSAPAQSAAASAATSASFIGAGSKPNGPGALL